MNKDMDSKKVTRSLSTLGVIVTLGIVFGDIGTSPLYVMRSIMNANTGFDTNYIIGAVSCIIWTLTMQTTVKYVFIALRADNKGEGGILALYALIRKRGKHWLYVVAIIGACTLIADGVITPAITVTSAMEGLSGISPNIPIVPVVLAVITLIFFIQQFGTHAIGRYFGPFMFLWFLMLGVFGAFSIGEYPLIFKAFNPYYAFNLLINYPNWFLVLGAVFLCTTGAEALYSDLGHCGRKNITVSWIYVKAMLIINYMGQGAYLINHIGRLSDNVNPFYAILPGWMLIIGIVMATGAAIIASQALISGCFTIFSEAVHLDFWPMLRIKYPSIVKGQLFIPLVNNVLYLFCMITVIAFKNSGRMEAAYGLAITVTMLCTTLMMSFYLKQHGAARWIVFVFVSVYFLIEGAFLLANLSKFTHGGWFTLMLAGLFSIIMLVWYKARRIRLAHLGFCKLSDYYGIISDIKADTTINRYASNLVYINRSGNKNMVEDKLVYSIINKSPKRADHYWLIHFERLDEPETLDYTCDELIPETLFSINIRIGFRIDPLMSLYLRQIIQDLVKEKHFDLRSCYPALRKFNIMGDFRFVVIHRIYYPSSVVSYYDNAIMKLYSMIKHIGVSEQRAFGLDTSNVTIENMPLIISDHYRQRVVKRQDGQDS